MEKLMVKELKIGVAIGTQRGTDNSVNTLVEEGIPGEKARKAMEGGGSSYENKTPPIEQVEIGMHTLA